MKISRKLWPALVIGCCAIAAFAQQQTVTKLYKKDGGLSLPDYRKWIYLGSGVGMTYTGEASENPPFTNVFAEPSAYGAFMKSGMWPNKTVLVAEMRGSDSHLSINKNGRVQTTKLIAVEIEIKDAAKGGWAFYGFEGGAQTGKLFPKTAACYSCHAEHAATDNTFVQFYPTLIETARQHKTFKEDS
jgi:hypothetical protein